jgi:hypothetical protein
VSGREGGGGGGGDGEVCGDTGGHMLTMVD